MKPSIGIRSVALAALFSAAATGSAFALSQYVRARALKVSQQQPSPDTWAEPVVETSPALVPIGRKLYLENCAHCHAADVTGDEGPDLHDLQVSDRYIAQMIRLGEPHQMPAFGKKLDRDSIRALSSYLRSLPSETP